MNTQTENQATNTISKRPKGHRLPTKDFIKLEAWKKCIEIKSVFSMEVIPFLPYEKQDDFGDLIKQAVSGITTDYVPYNRIVSKRHEKRSSQEEIQSIRAIRFSLSSLKNYIAVCSDFNYINSHTYNKGVLLIEQTKTLLNRYIYYLSR